MKFTFFGTSHGLPEKDRYCSCTMLETGEKKYIIDMGAPFADIAVRHGISCADISDIFITHAHLDHCGGLPIFMTLGKWHFMQSAITAYLPDKELLNAMKPLIEVRMDESNPNIKIRKYEAGEIFNDGTIRVTAIPTEHMKNVDRLSYAFDLEAEGKRILFTGDLTAEMNDFPQVAFENHFDLIVTECAHAPKETLERILRRLDVEQVVIMHIYPQEKIDYFKKISSSFDFPIIVPDDNDELEICD